jgi:hypothetical protein
MIDYLIHFFTYNKIYLFTGAALLLLILLPTKGKISPKSKKALFLFALIWIVCFAYRINTGQDIIYLFNKKDNFTNERQSAGIKKGPFSKYYSNDAGREAKTGKK